MWEGAKVYCKICSRYSSYFYFFKLVFTFFLNVVCDKYLFDGVCMIYVCICKCAGIFGGFKLCCMCKRARESVCMCV